MSWELYRSTMERHAIKTDDMATEDAYFMATHMPFSSLELFRGGYYEEGKKFFTTMGGDSFYFISAIVVLSVVFFPNLRKNNRQRLSL